MSTLRILTIVGARPNFIKAAALARAWHRYGLRRAPGQPVIEQRLVHTGQHYDDALSQAFFRDLAIPPADITLGIGSGSHAEQVGRTMMALEPVLRQERPDWVVVVGDVNAVCAASITAKKEHLRVAHVEAGLRSRDMEMPEEINRLVADRLADLLFAPDREACNNLRAEGVPAGRIACAGNVMIDVLDDERPRAAALDVGEIIARNLLVPRPVAPLPDGGFGVVTLHRPSNLDTEGALAPLVAALIELSETELPLVWPAHPRLRRQAERFGLWERLSAAPRLHVLQPVGYHAMLKLNLSSRVVLTDSGGLQEECCVLGTPCITMRSNTERPATLREHGGTGVLAGNDVQCVTAAFRDALAQPRRPFRPEGWDGHAADRIVQVLAASCPLSPVPCPLSPDP